MPAVQPWRPRVLIVANPISGGGRAARMADELSRALEGVVASSRRIDSLPAPASQWLAPALHDADLVVVTGGDGAVRQVAPLLADRRACLWHAPAGTENLFGRAFGMRANASALTAAIAARRTCLIDIASATPEDGDAAGQPVAFVLMASCGFDAEVVHRLASVRRGAISHLSYLRPTLETLWSFRAARVRVDPDQHRIAVGNAGDLGIIGGIVIANAPAYAANINPVPAARFDDGLLHAAILPGASGWAALAWALRCRVGRAPPSRAAQSIRVQVDPPMHWQLDGDSAPWGRVRCVSFTLRQRCVRILMPASNAPEGVEETSHPSLVHPPEDWIVSPSDQEV